MDRWRAELEAAHTRAGGDPTRMLSPKQRAFHRDLSTKRKWLGTRRSGKTLGLAIHCLECAVPGEEIPFITTTIAVGRRNLWTPLEQLDRQFNLGLKFDRSKHRVITRRGGAIQLYGLSTKPEAEKLRGGRYPLAVIDECGHLNQELLKVCVREAVGPATGDFIGIGGRGVVLAGTPSKLLDTFWHDECKDGIDGNDKSFHFTTVYDNPFFKGREELVRSQYLSDNKLKATDAAFIREMDGRFIIDLEALCYFAAGIVQVPASALPANGVTIMGVDFGVTHPCAFVVIRVVDDGLGGKHIFFLESYLETGMTERQVAAKMRELRSKWNVAYMIGDSEGAMAIKGLNKNHGLPIKSAVKAGKKVDRIWNLDSHLRSGTAFFGPETASLQEEIRSVGWNEKRDDHHENQSDHGPDAAHYALEMASALGAVAKAPRPERGSPEWLKEEAEKTVRWAELAAAAGATRRR